MLFYTTTRSNMESMDDTMLLIGYDVSKNCMAFCTKVNAASEANVPNSTSIYEDFVQQIPGCPGSTEL